MEVTLSPAQQAFAHEAIASGRLANEAEAIHEAMELWEQRQRRRAEILAAVDLAEASLAAGKGRTITNTSVRELAREVERRGQARLARMGNSR
jgi:Arc/MetJ-type ribon-helix-helix transcriptional regulator